MGSVVQVHPDPPETLAEEQSKSAFRTGNPKGAIAQLGERLLCKQEVTGSIPVGSTRIVRELSAKRNPFRFAVSFFSAAL